MNLESCLESEISLENMSLDPRHSLHRVSWPVLSIRAQDIIRHILDGCIFGRIVEDINVPTRNANLK